MRRTLVVLLWIALALSPFVLVLGLIFSIELVAFAGDNSNEVQDRSAFLMQGSLIVTLGLLIVIEGMISGLIGFRRRFGATPVMRGVSALIGTVLIGVGLFVAERGFQAPDDRWDAVKWGIVSDVAQCCLITFVGGFGFTRLLVLHRGRAPRLH